MVWQKRCGDVGVEFRSELPQSTVLADSDAGRVRQIIDGLCENALRVTPEGRPIVLALRREPGAHPSGQGVSDGVTKAVGDAGPHAAPEASEQVAERAAPEASPAKFFKTSIQSCIAMRMAKMPT